MPDSPRARDPLHSISLNVNRWLASGTVALLGLTGEAIYLRLLMHQWKNEDDGLPAEPEQLRRLTGATPRDWKAAWSLLERHFPLGQDNRRRNPVLADEWEFCSSRRARKSKAGIMGNQKRWNRDSSPPPDDPEPDRNAIAGRSQDDRTVVADRSQSGRPSPSPSLTATADAAAVTRSASAAAADDGMADRFEALAHRAAYLAFRAVHPNPAGLDSTLGMMLDGPGGPAGRPVTLWQMGSAFADAYGNGVTTFNAQHFRGFLAKAPKQRPDAPTIALVRQDEAGTVRDAEGKLVWYPGCPPQDQPTPEQIAANGWSVAA